jgi:hypothetical protein
MNEMRERLIRLLQEAEGQAAYYDGDDAYGVAADFLLDNGVIVPPVKMGQTVYDVDPNGLIREYRVSMITQKANGEYKARLSHNGYVAEYTEGELKRYLLPTIEAAEATLKAREKQ